MKQIKTKQHCPTSSTEILPQIFIKEVLIKRLTTTGFSAPELNYQSGDHLKKVWF